MTLRTHACRVGTRADAWLSFIKQQRSHEHQRGCARVIKVRNSGRIGEARVRQAMAEITLARTCPYTSMAPVMAIIKLVAATVRSVARPRWREWEVESQPGRTAVNKT